MKQEIKQPGPGYLAPSLTSQVDLRQRVRSAAHAKRMQDRRREHIEHASGVAGRIYGGQRNGELQEADGLAVGEGLSAAEETNLRAPPHGLGLEMLGLAIAEGLVFGLSQLLGGAPAGMAAGYWGACAAAIAALSHFAMFRIAFQHRTHTEAQRLIALRTTLVFGVAMAGTFACLGYVSAARIGPLAGLQNPAALVALLAGLPYVAAVALLGGRVVTAQVLDVRIAESTVGNAIGRRRSAVLKKQGEHYIDDEAMKTFLAPPDDASRARLTDDTTERRP